MKKSSTFETPVLPKYIPQLDGLRAVAILSVMLFHQQIPGFNMGWAGVQLFFVISGFLITGILLDTKTSSHYFRNFYARRFIRIFPVYYLGLGAVIVIALIFRWGIGDVWYYVLYIQNHLLAVNNWRVQFPALFNHSWSLAVEEQFYILWPLIIYALDVKKLKIATIFLFFFALLSRTFLLFFTQNPNLQFMILPTQVDALAAGSFLAIILREGNAQTLRRLSAWSAGLLLLSGIGIVALALRTGYDAYWVPAGWGNSRSNLVLFSLMSIFFASLLYVSIFSKSALKSVLEHPWLRHIGKISYGLYLYHYPIFVSADLIALETVGGEPDTLYYITEVILTFGLSYLLAILSWKWFETPILKLKDRYS